MRSTAGHLLLRTHLHGTQSSQPPAPHRAPLSPAFLRPLLPSVLLSARMLAPLLHLLSVTLLRLPEQGCRYAQDPSAFSASAQAAFLPRVPPGAPLTCSFSSWDQQFPTTLWDSQGQVGGHGGGGGCREDWKLGVARISGKHLGLRFGLCRLGD